MSNSVPLNALQSVINVQYPKIDFVLESLINPRDNTRPPGQEPRRYHRAPSHNPKAYPKFLTLMLTLIRWFLFGHHCHQRWPATSMLPDKSSSVI